MRKGAIKKCILVLLSLLLAIPAVSFALNENEPNDQSYKANQMNNGTIYNGDAKSIDDKDWFYFNATGTDIDLYFNASESAWSVDVRNKDSEFIQYWIVDASNSTKEINKSFTDLKQNNGIHYIVIRPLTNNLSAESEYNLQVQGKIDNDPGEPDVLFGTKLETEPNDIWYKADNLIADTRYTGHMKSPDDEDWFKFYIEQPCQVKLEDFIISGKERDFNSTSSGSEWEIKVYNDLIEKTGIEEDVFVSWKDAKDPTRYFNKGMYYLNISIDGEGSGYKNLELSGEYLSDQSLPETNIQKVQPKDEGSQVELNATKPSGSEVKWTEVWWNNRNVNNIRPWDHNDTSITLSNQTSATPSFKAPSVPPKQKQFTFEIKVMNSTDNRYYDKDRVTVTVKDVPKGGGTSDGGIGCNYHSDADFGWGWFAMLIGVAALPWLRKKIAR